MKDTDYEIINVDDHSLSDLALVIATGGLCGFFGKCSDNTYTVKYEDGSVKKIDVKNKEELHKKILNKI